MTLWTWAPETCTPNPTLCTKTYEKVVEQIAALNESNIQDIYWYKIQFNIEQQSNIPLLTMLSNVNY